MNPGSPSFEDAFKPDAFKPQYDELLDGPRSPKESPASAKARSEQEQADIALAVSRGLAELEATVQSLSREKALAENKLLFKGTALSVVSEKAKMHFLTLSSLIQAAKTLEANKERELKMTDLQDRLDRLAA